MNIAEKLNDHQAVMNKLHDLIPLIEQAAQQIVTSIQNGGQIYFMGNGGSAADAQHLAAELIGRFMLERRALPGIALTTDTSVLSCLGNDYDFTVVYARQLEALCKPNDTVVALTTSGTSKNILKAIDVAKKIGAYTIGLTGQTGGQLKDKVDLCFCIPSMNTPRIQEAHIFIGHTMCELVENTFAMSEEKAEEATA